MSALATVADWARHSRNFLRPLPDGDDEVTLPPPLPDGNVVFVPERGEMFVREAPGASQGPTVLLLHGWTLSADLNWFSGVYDVATRRGRMVAPDLRGHGRGLRSTEPFTLDAAVEDVAGLIRELELGPVVTVGYSMGGSLSLLLAHRHPELVAGMVLASTALQWRASVRERAVWAVLGGVEWVMRLGAPEGITDRYLRQAVEEAPDLKPYRSWLKAEARRGDPVDIAASAKELTRFDARSFAGGLEVPTVVVVTCNDHLIRADKQRALADAVPGAKALEVQGAHNAWMVKPEEWAGAIDEAIDLVLQQIGAPARGPATSRALAPDEVRATSRPAGRPGRRPKE
ncbi:MAG: alpha/beta fold hydrolase [Acidimicrobiales bacterium]